MNHYLKRLKIILQYNYIYYLLLLLCFIYVIIYLSLYKCDHKYDIKDNTFYIKIINYKLYDNRIKINTNNLVCFYYFENEKEKKDFINNNSLGDTLEVYGILSIPSNNTIPNTFNYKKYLYRNNIEYILNIKSFKKIKDNKNIFYNIKNNIYKRVNNISNNEYLYAFILGDSSHIDNESYNNYKTNGILHLYAVSSLHISLFSSFLFKLLRKIKIKYNISFLIVSIILLFYSFVVSFVPSILRAFFFFTINKVFKIINIKTSKINILLLTITIILFINPNYIYNNGFLLSITVSLFIHLYKGKKTLFNINTIAFISSLPIVINMYYEINILSILNNLIFIPIISKIIFPFSLICLIIPELTIILKILTDILEFVSMICSKVLTINIIFSKISAIEIIIYYLLLILTIRIKKYYKYLLILFIIFLYIKPYLNNNNYVYFLDVNQGDSTLIIKDNINILIDTGGIQNSDKMTTSIIPFFKSIGIKKIDYLILTHGDYDHMGYSIDLINNFKVKNVIYNCGQFNDLENDLIKILNKKNISYDSCINELENLLFLQTKYYNDENDNSNVIYTEIDGYRFMFMGDAGIEKERDILDKYNISNIDVLKVGHHGSKTSSSEIFINEMNPKYVVISVGKNNHYGHPNEEVLNILNNSKIYRTDTDGSIMFKIKNNRLNIETCSP